MGDRRSHDAVASSVQVAGPPQGMSNRDSIGPRDPRDPGKPLRDP